MILMEGEAVGDQKVEESEGFTWLMGTVACIWCFHIHIVLSTQSTSRV